MPLSLVQALAAFAAAVFGWNIVAAALGLAWFARPLAVLRWISVDLLADSFAGWVGRVVAVFYISLADVLAAMYTRLRPALHETFGQAFDIAFSGLYGACNMAGAWFAAVWAYHPVIESPLTPTMLLALSVAGMAGVLSYRFFLAPSTDEAPDGQRRERPRSVSAGSAAVAPLRR